MVLYREEVGELAVKELLQLALVEFVFVSIVARVVVENRYQRIHRTLELSRHSAERTGTGRQRVRGGITKTGPLMCGEVLLPGESRTQVWRSAAVLLVYQ